MKYYSSELLTDDFLLNEEELSNYELYYRSIFNNTLNVVMAEEILCSKTSRVFYYDVLKEDEVIEYHKRKYKNIRQVLYYNLDERTKILKIYILGVLHSEWIFHYNSKCQILKSILFDKFKNLIEYREYIYNEVGNQVFEKIFFAGSWVINTERII